MPKTKAQKKAAKKVERAELLQTLSRGSNTKTMSNVLTAGDKLAKKRKKGGFWGMIGGAAKFAMDLAPIVAPLLLGSHAPTMAAAKALGSTASAATAGVPLAAPANCAACVGLYGMKSKNSPSGRIEAIKLRGMDYLGALNNDSNGVAAGVKLSEINLNPFSAQWNGTSLQRFASLFERYRPHRICAIVEPSTPATSEGQIISYIDPDPDDEFTQTGRTAIQIASTHEGADVSQVWGMNCSCYAFDETTQDFYSDADGSDERLISPGVWRILSNTAIPDTVDAIGSLYVVWEYTLKITQIEEFSGGGSWGLWTPSGVDQDSLFGASAAPVVLDDGNIVVNVSDDNPGNGSALYGLSQGFYLLELTCQSASAYSGTPSLVVSVDGVNYLNPADPTDSVITALTTVTSTDKTLLTATYLFQVSSKSNTPPEGFLFVVGNLGTNSDTIVTLSQVQSGLPAARRKKTLQQYERQLDAMKESIATLARAMATFPLPAAAAAATTTSTGLSSSSLLALQQLSRLAH